MSFCQDTKNDLCALPYKNKCCRLALLYGALLSGNTFCAEKIRLVTENARTGELILHLLRDIYGIKGNIYISEKKSGEGKVHSYKLTVSAREDLKKLSELYPDVRSDESREIINRALFSCADCKRYFFRGAFLTAGTVTDPMSGYRVELTFSRESLACAILELLEELGFSPKFAVRKTSAVVYMKESENTEDFLTFIGASQASLAIMNAKIYKDIRNAQNRLSNCDAANINRMTGSAQEHIRMIRTLERAGMLEFLPEDLRVTAELRRENPEASLAVLAELHIPPITKSGVHHRLARIEQCYEELKNKS